MVEATGRERKRKERNGKERVGSHDIAIYKERKVEEEKTTTEFCIALLAVDSPDYNRTVTQTRDKLSNCVWFAASTK
jgi:hypothetical protein